LTVTCAQGRIREINCCRKNRFAMKTLENINDRNNERWLSFLSIGSTLIAVLFPKCPLCALAIFSVFGISADFDAGAFYLLTLVFILLGLGAMALRTVRKRNYKPLYLAIAASFLVLAGKFHFDSPVIFYVGIGMFITTVAYSNYQLAKDKCRKNCNC
jgi:hypothetical protein